MMQNKRNKMLRKFMLLMVLGAILILVTACSNENEEIVAKVNGESISKEELYELLVGQGGAQALDALVTQKMIELEVEDQKIEVTDADIEAQLKELQAAYGGEEAFNQAISAAGFAIDRVKNDIAMDLKVKKLLEPRITISEDEMKQYFEENKDIFAQEEQVKASHILVETEDLAKQIQERLQSGEDFAELAKQYSADESNKEVGGDLGFIGRGWMGEAFDNAAFSLKVGEISEPVQTESGYHIIKVAERKEAKEANYDESIEEIREYLMNEKMQAEYNIWIDELYNKYEVENYL